MRTGSFSTRWPRARVFPIPNGAKIGPEEKMRATKRFFLFLSVALSLVISGQVLQAKAATGSLEGTVLDSQGKPVSGALVTIQASYGAHPHVTHTDASGHFEFSHFAAGQYDLRAYYSGSYSDWSKRVPLRTTKNDPVTLQIAASKR
jgi:Carboxypeptidase regulatory-like domain